MKSGKFRIFCCLIILSRAVTAQIVSEKFESGDLSKWLQYPEGHWNISSEMAISGNKSLHQYSDSSIAGEDRISLSTAGLSCEFDTVKFRFKLKHGSNPSLSNRWAVYLAYDEDASQMYPGGRGNGFAIGVNMNNSDDCLRLYRVVEGVFQEILNTKFNWELLVGTTHAASIEINKYPHGIWNVWIDRTGNYDSLINYGSCVNTEHVEALNFGIYYDYTATRNGLFWFDELAIEGKFISDTIVPFVRLISVLNDTSLCLRFSENMNFHVPDLTSKFILEEGMINPARVEIIDKDSVILRFNFKFSDRSMLYVIIGDLVDISANPMQTDTLSCFFARIKLNDICINEIMPDPSPSIRLPEYEYIELFNRMDYPVNIGGWIISAGSETKILPSFSLQGKEYLILCQASAVNSFKMYGSVIGIFPSGSFLSNSESCVQLETADSLIISQVCYSSDWIDDSKKKDGGWSLEKLDPDIPCSAKGNWIASKDKIGGTPGKENSTLRNTGDHRAPIITGIFPDSDSSLVVSFDETVGLNYPLCAGSFLVDHEIGAARSCSVQRTDYTSFRLIFAGHFEQNYSYSIIHDSSIMDCAGNKLEIKELKFQLPSLPDSQDVVFNEIMYHPVSGCPEFIELFNRSSKVMNLAEFSICTVDLYSGQIKSVYKGSQEDKLFFPGEYYVLTSDKESLLNCYQPPENNTIIQINSMPVLTDEGQKLQLIAHDLSIIDEMTYKDAMQYPLLSNSIGVSLERIDYNRPSNDPSNWHSASSGSGYCTPGSENSQFFETGNSSSVLSISPEIFSPDNDGINDVLSISYSFNETGFAGNIVVYDSEGREIKRLANNSLLSFNGQFNWDGEDEGGRVCRQGIYIIRFEVFNPAGKTALYKAVCVISLSN